MVGDILIAPSFNSLFITGIIILFIFFIFIKNIKKIYNLNYYSQLNILELIGIIIGVHGLIHLGVESVYGFNPYRWL
jgi:hypothetical protein